MFNERLNRIVGLVALAVVVAGTTAVLMVGDRPLVAAVHFTIFFDRVGRLRPGAPVRMDNMDLGRVESISYETKDTDTKETGEKRKGAQAPAQQGGFGRDDESLHGRVRVVVWVRRSYRSFVRKNSRFLITATSLIGARHVEVLPPKGEPGPAIEQGDTVVGEPPPHIDRMLRMAYENLKRSTDLLEKLRPDLEAFSEESRRSRALLADLSQEKQHLVGMWHHGRRAYEEWGRNWRVLSRSTKKGRRVERLAQRMASTARHISARAQTLRRRVDALKSKIESIDGNWRSVRTHPLRRRLPALVRRFRNLVHGISANVKVVERAVKHAKGTVGALMKDHEIWDDFKESQRVIKQRIWTIMGKGKQSSPKGYPVP